MNPLSLPKNYPKLFMLCTIILCITTGVCIYFIVQFENESQVNTRDKRECERINKIIKQEKDKCEKDKEYVDSAFKKLQNDFKNTCENGRCGFEIDFVESFNSEVNYKKTCEKHNDCSEGYTCRLSRLTSNPLNNKGVCVAEGVYLNIEDDFNTKLESRNNKKESAECSINQCDQGLVCTSNDPKTRKKADSYNELREPFYDIRRKKYFKYETSKNSRYKNTCTDPNKLEDYCAHNGLVVKCASTPPQKIHPS